MTFTRSQRTRSDLPVRMWLEWAVVTEAVSKVAETLNQYRGRYAIDPELSRLRHVGWLMSHD